MSMEQEESNFDIESGVAEIAADMGWGESADDDNELGGELDDDTAPEEIEEPPLEPEEEAAPEIAAKSPPASWSKDQHEHWAKMTPEQQDYVELREKQMLDGIEQYKQGHQYAIEMNRMLDPYRENIHRNGVTETEAIQNLFNHHMALTEGSIESRQERFIALGMDLGLIPQDGQQQIDPNTRMLQERLERIENQDRQRQQHIYQQNLSKVEQEVNAFASDPVNVYFDEVADDVLIHLQSGLDLQSAYDRAVWANPITRAKELAKSIEEQTKTAAKKRTEEALSAQKASSINVRQISSKRESNAPTGSMDDTMQEVLAKIRNK